jgi:hypothetical protein
MPTVASTGSLAGYVLSPLASAALAVFVVSRVDAGRSQVREARTIRLMLRNILGIGPARQPIDWLFVTEAQYEALSQELLFLSDRAFAVDPDSGLALRDAAQRVNDLGRLALTTKALREQFDKEYDVGERNLRTIGRRVLRNRDLALGAARELYKYLDLADMLLGKAKPWWFVSTRARSAPPSPFTQVVAYLDPLLADASADIHTGPPSSAEREIGRLGGLDGMGLRQTGDPELDNDARRWLLWRDRAD